MAFSFGGALAGAISGAASGFMMGGGPYGAIAGGVIGGAAGGFGAGPSSIGGITGGKTGSGAAAGVQQREYWDEANPGTNAWERLGSGSAMASVLSAGVQAKTAEKNTALVTNTAKINTAVQTSAAVKVAKIQAAGAQAVASTHAGPAKTAADAAATQAGSGVIGAESGRVTAAASKSQAESARARLLIDAEKMLTERGKAFRSPELAALASRAAQTFTYGMKSSKDWEAHLAKGWWKVYMAAGVAAHTIREGADAVGKVLGSRVRPAGGPAGGKPFPTKTSAPYVAPKEGPYKVKPRR